VAAIIYKISTK